MKKRRLTDAELEASRWIARLEASDVSLADHDAFRAWLDSSPENRAAHEAVSRSWDQLDALKVLAADVSASPSPAKPSRRALLLAGGAGAATVAAAGLIWLAIPAPTFAATYETSIGERERATLQDGSELELNAVTSIKVAFTERARLVTLERGEALFTIVSDQRLFQVRAGGKVVTVSPGAYLVRSHSEGVRLTVISGAANVRGMPAPLNSGSEAVLGSGAAAIHEIGLENASRRLAWRDHMLALDGDSLADAAAEVERQTGARFVFADASLGDLVVSGYIDARDPRAFIALLETNLGVSARERADGAVELSR